MACASAEQERLYSNDVLLGPATASVISTHVLVQQPDHVISVPDFIGQMEVGVAVNGSFSRMGDLRLMSRALANAF